MLHATGTSAKVDGKDGQQQGSMGMLQRMLGSLGIGPAHEAKMTSDCHHRQLNDESLDMMLGEPYGSQEPLVGLQEPYTNIEPPQPRRHSSHGQQGQGQGYHNMASPLVDVDGPPSPLTERRRRSGSLGVGLAGGSPSPLVQVHSSTPPPTNTMAYHIHQAERAGVVSHGHQPASSPQDIAGGGSEGGSSSIPKSMSLPLRHTAPNPFPELANSPLTPPPVSQILSEHGYSDASRSSPSSPLLRRGRHSPGSISPAGLLSRSRESLDRSSSECLAWTPSVYTKLMVNFCLDDNNSKTVSIEEKMRASDVAHLLVLKSHAKEDKNWVVVEHISKFDMERGLEDHESVHQIYRGWGNTEENKFCFRRDFRKYELFYNPPQFFPPHMLHIENKEDTPGLIYDRTERHRVLLLQNLFSTTCKLPDIQGHMYIREGKRSWKKHFFVLRASGLYYSTKGTSKEPRHLVFYASLTDFNIYTANNAKKTFGAPNNHCICLKPPYTVSDAKDLKVMCSEDEQSKLCWLTGFRLIKYGTMLRENFKTAIRYEEKLKSKEERRPQKEGGMTTVKSRVAMDFTGNSGRVVDDPNEALGVAMEEAKRWRKKAAPRPPGKTPVMSNSPKAYSFLSDLPAKSSHGLSSGIHMVQPWFHSGISRFEAVELIQAQGLVDGVFLLRESHSTPDAYVLSLAHNQKVKHCQILQLETDDGIYFSLDGHTKFQDLTQLVEFYQLNAGGLPTKLTHYVTKTV